MRASVEAADFRAVQAGERVRASMRWPQAEYWRREGSALGEERAEAVVWWRVEQRWEREVREVKILERVEEGREEGRWRRRVRGIDGVVV